MTSIGSNVFKSKYEGSGSPSALFDLGNKLDAVNNPISKSLIEKIRKTAKSVGALVYSNNFEMRQEGDPWVVKQSFFDSDLGTLEKKLINDLFRCDLIKKCNISFKDEPCLSAGTAFLIAKDIAFTKAHCLFHKPHRNEPLDDGFPKQKLGGAPDLLIFDYDYPPIKGDQWDLKFPAENVYKIKSVIAYELFKDEDKQTRDWALIKLERTVTPDRKPLKINFSSSLKEGTDVWMVGHMQGLPKKWRGNAKIMQVNSIVTNRDGKQLLCPDFFGANLNAFAGDSGAPVIGLPTCEVIGSIDCGHRDYVLVKGVLQESTISDEKIKEHGYEHCLKMSSLAFLKPFFSLQTSLFFPNPPKHKQAEGITLEGECNNPKCEPSSFPIASADMVDILKYKIKCRHCNQDIKDKVMVLFNCRYEIKAITTENKKFEGSFLFQRLNQKFGGELRFNLEEWKVLQIRRTDIPLSFTKIIGNYLPSKKTVIHVLVVGGSVMILAAAPAWAPAAIPVLKVANVIVKVCAVGNNIKIFAVGYAVFNFSTYLRYPIPQKAIINKLK